MVISSVFLMATRGCSHQPRGEGEETTKSRDPHFILTLSGKYSPACLIWGGGGGGGGGG